MRRKIAGLLFTVAALCCFAPAARACSCIVTFEHYQPCGAYWRSDVVFTGVVTEQGERPPIEGSDGKLFSTKGRITRLTVEEAFRGVTGTVVETIEFGTSCDYHFTIGERYFVYGSLDPQSGKVAVHSCTATKTLDRAAADLEYARGVARGERTPSIVGYVTRETRADAASYRRQNPVEAIKITAEDAGRSFETRTDAKGAFRFFGLPVGKYRVRAIAPPELRRLYDKDALEVETADGRCRGAGFTFTSLSTISGKVVDARGNAVKTKLNLVALDADDKEIPPAEGSVETYTDDEGRYTFDLIAPGRYLVAVNPGKQPGRYDPAYPRAYHPGVREAAQAFVIAIADGEQYQAGTFRLPAPLKERTIEGVVFMPDGSPATGATVILEYTDREWMEVEGTDAQGRFTLKVYEGYKYLVAAELRHDGKARHSEFVELNAGAETGPLTLVITQPGNYTLRYILRKRDKRQ